MGRRFARGVRAVVYNDNAVVYTGPVLQNCSLRTDRYLYLDIDFNAALLKDDAVHVWAAESTQSAFLSQVFLSCINGSSMQLRQDGYCSGIQTTPPYSPLEVE